MPSSLSPEQRSLRASGAAYARWAKHDPREAMQHVRDGRWEREVDPEGLLPPAERKRRAEAAMRAHMQFMALESSKRRAARRAEK